MFLVNLTNLLTLSLVLAFILLLIFLGKELKKSYITAIPLAVSLGLLIMHVIQLMTLPLEFMDMSPTLIWCSVIDLALIFVTLISYLWVDDIEAKKMNKKSIDNSLEWFWKEI